MRFSIVIPTQDRPTLLAVAVKHAMQLDHPDFEVIVSDNSTNDDFTRLNSEAVSGYECAPNFKLVRPPRVLSPPEHFEFALDFATGDYVAYLTDKMVVLPHTLAAAEAAIRTSGADIVNWAYAPYQIDDSKNPSGPGALTEEFEFLNGKPKSYDPNAALRFKASCAVPRDKQHTRDYLLGKIIFGCYSRELIDRIRSNSGTVFGGATHDYSAMIQALSLAHGCVMLNTYGVLFISLPLDQSLGSLTALDSQAAMRYFRSFADPEFILSSLFVPGLYASQHNMVAHDYKKFLPLYGKMNCFGETNWLWAIQADLANDSKKWIDSVEKNTQLNLFARHADLTGQRLPLKAMRQRLQFAAMSKKHLAPVISLVNRILRRQIVPSGRTFAAKSLADAIEHVSTHSAMSKRLP